MTEPKRSALRVRKGSVYSMSADGFIYHSPENCAEIVSVRKDGDRHVAVVRQGDKEATASAEEDHDAIIQAAVKLFEGDGEPAVGETYVIEGGNSAWYQWVPGRDEREPKPAPTHLFAGGRIPYGMMQDYIERLAGEMRPREQRDGTGSPT